MHINHKNFALKRQQGSYMVWIIFLLPVLVATLAFSVDIGKYYDDASQIQTVADSAALAGINALRRVFDEDTATMSAVCKAGFISEAVSDALTRMANGADAGGMGFDVDDVELIYCPRSSEPLVSGEGPCWVIPPDANCGVDCDCGGFAGSIAAYINEDTEDKPGKGFYPLNSELPDSGEGEEDSAGYVYVRLNKQTDGYFLGLLGILNFPSIEVTAMARHRFKPKFYCPGMYAPVENLNDPEPVNLRNGSRLIITDGGITIRDEVQNSIGSSNQPNWIEAEWIKIWGEIYSGQITYTCDPSYPICPEVLQNSSIDYYGPIEQDQYLATGYAERIAYCNSSAYSTSCIPVDNEEVGYIYVNCELSGPGPHELMAGTYCGGLTLTDVGGTAAAPGVVLRPRIEDGILVDDVFYFVPRDLPGNNQDRPGLLDINGWSQGQNIRYSFIEVGYDNDIPDAGVIIYAPVADGQEYAVDLDITRFNDPGAGADVGNLRLHTDNLRLVDSTLAFKVYKGGDGCDEDLEEITPYSGLVQ